MKRKKKKKGENLPPHKQYIWLCLNCDWKGNNTKTALTLQENSLGHPTWNICPECEVPVVWNTGDE